MKKVNLVPKKCIFCQIVAGEVQTKKIFEDDDFVVFDDVNPRAPVHVLIVPKVHVATVGELSEADEPMMGRVFTLATKLAQELKIQDGFQLHINSGRIAGQVVFHLHVHLTGGWSSPQRA